MIVTSLATLATIERWFLETCEASTNSLARLSRENSLYESYNEFCQQEGSTPVGIKQFAKTVELLIGRYFDKIFTTTRNKSKGFSSKKSL